MRIDLNGLLASRLSADKVSQSANGKAKVQANTVGQDQISLSSDTVGLAGLEAKAAQTPEIRQEKVDALRQDIQKGTYKIDPGKIADAMLREVTKK